MNDTTTKPANRVPGIKPEIANRLPKDREQLSAPFEELCGRLYESLALVKRPVSTTEQIIDALGVSINQLSLFCTEWRSLLSDSIRANIEVRTDAANAGRRGQLHAQVMSELAPFLPEMRIAVPDLITFDSLALAPKELYEFVEQPVAELTRAVCATAASSAVELCQKSILGTVEVHPQNARVARCTFSRAVLIQEQTSTSAVSESSETDTRTENRGNNNWKVSRETHTTTTTTTDQQQTRRHAQHTHLVYDAEWLTLPGDGLKRPDFAEQLIQSIPASLRPFISILAGKMAKEHIVEKDIAQKKWTEVSKEDRVTHTVIAEGRLYDPVVTFGGKFILCGWSGRDLKGA